MLVGIVVSVDVWPVLFPPQVKAGKAVQKKIAAAKKLLKRSFSKENAGAVLALKKVGRVAKDGSLLAEKIFEVSRKVLRKLFHRLTVVSFKVGLTAAQVTAVKKKNAFGAATLAFMSACAKYHKAKRADRKRRAGAKTASAVQSELESGLDSTGSFGSGRSMMPLLDFLKMKREQAKKHKTKLGAVWKRKQERVKTMARQAAKIKNFLDKKKADRIRKKAAYALSKASYILKKSMSVAHKDIPAAKRAAARAEKKGRDLKLMLGLMLTERATRDVAKVLKQEAKTEKHEAAHIAQVYDSFCFRSMVLLFTLKRQR